MKAEAYTDLMLESGTFRTTLTDKYANRKLWIKHPEEEIRASLPGVVVEINVKAGDFVREGNILLTLDAMKMLNRINAPADGRVKEVMAVTGDKIAKDDLLIVFDAEK
jgi:biotin carboxyl carrier protein